MKNLEILGKYNVPRKKKNIRVHIFRVSLFKIYDIPGISLAHTIPLGKLSELTTMHGPPA